MRKNQKGFSAVLVLVLLVVVGVGAYYFSSKGKTPSISVSSPTPFPDAGVCPVRRNSYGSRSVSYPSPDEEYYKLETGESFKIYTNTLLGFTVKYPSQFKEHAAETGLSISTPGFWREGSGPDTLPSFNEMEVHINFEKTNVTSFNELQNYVKELDNTDGELGFQITKQSRAKVDNIDAIRYEWKSYDEVVDLLYGDGEIITLLYKGCMLSIIKRPLRTSQQQKFEQFLSTFKFLN